MEEFFVKNLNGNDYLSGGSEPMMIDFHAYPIVERIVLLEGGVRASAFEFLGVKETCPTIYAYVHRFRSNAKVNASIITQEAYNKYNETNVNVEGKLPLNHAVLGH